MGQKYKTGWTAMEDASQADFEAVVDFEADYNAALVDRLLAQLKELDEPWTPYPINRYQHSLQSATRALND
ncbi:MAG: phosphohydrolase, partial [Gammaproteobacteria bacterium]|nr:phosphohydrolase [Gammaproteobacteria bacterium]